MDGEVLRLLDLVAGDDPGAEGRKGVEALAYVPGVVPAAPPGIALADIPAPSRLKGRLSNVTNLRCPVVSSLRRFVFGAQRKTRAITCANNWGSKKPRILRRHQQPSISLIPKLLVFLKRHGVA
jgi:hypothetical protein